MRLASFLSAQTGENMRKISFNDNWECCPVDCQDQKMEINLPFDAMLLDDKKEDCAGGVNIGWIDARDYIFEKNFTAPEEWKEREVIFEFEGVYQTASVYINGTKVESHSYGYTGFYINAGQWIRYGENNTICVRAMNSSQPNSRWYTGTGIYRPVWLYVLPKAYICMDGIKITTVDAERRKIRISTETTAKGMVRFEILDNNKVIKVIEDETQGHYETVTELPEIRLWSPDTPVLYNCRVVYTSAYGEADEESVKFGIRSVTCNSQDGFCINGKRVILKGACIHHDNGLLGACAYDFAEKRKIRLLKENGYNAIRSAHNPCSKALLNACDELGMLVVDEYVDMWYIHKTKYDYANKVKQNYKKDLKCIVDKDYNHPSVIMYSTGNEVAETAQKEGIELCRNMTEYLHNIDSSRPVTCGINIFFNFLSSMGFGVYSDKKADQAAENVKKKKAVGSEFFNRLSGIMGAGFMKFGATLYPCDMKTRDAFAALDVAGYNYGINRYEHDLKKYPNRIILGSETFCSDAYRFYELAKKNPRIIGDFVWAGMDYLGETGIGACEYKEYAPRFDGGYGWVSAGAGRIDLTGKPLAEMAYTRVAFGLQDIAIGVIPVNNTNSPHSPSAWKMSNAVESWSWNGCDGKEAQVEVYARAHHVSIYINSDHAAGTKEMKNDCRAVFRTVYEPGEIRAVAFDEQGNKLAECSLRSAGDETKLSLEPEANCITRDDLLYVRMKYTDKNGIVKPFARGDIRVVVEGGKILGIGSACPYYEKSYLGDTADTYYGEAMVIIRPEAGNRIVVNAESKYGNARTEAVVL